MYFSDRHNKKLNHSSKFQLLKLKNQNTFYKLPLLDGLEVLDAKHHTHTFPFHTHNTFNITLTLKQTFDTRLYNRLFQAPAGMIVVTNPDEVHSTICDTKTGSSFFTFYVSPDVLTVLNNRRPLFFEKKIINDALLFQQLFNASQQFAASVPGTEKVLLQALKGLVKNHAAGSFTPHKINTNFQRFLEEEPFQKFSLEQAARRFGLDKFKFLRLFKDETGLTPNNYIILKRIEKSKQLLQTSADLLDIALETGFYDATHLCKYFKKITGITPLAYRNA